MFVMPYAPAVLRTQRHTARPVDPAASIARVFDHLFDNVPLQAAPTPVRTPALNVAETDTHYLLSYELPGVAKAALKVSIDGRRVQIETIAPAAEAQGASVKDETGADPAATAVDTTAPRLLYRERTGSRYARTVSLPQEVNPGASDARFEDGVLTLSLAKRRRDGAHELKVS